MPGCNPTFGDRKLVKIVDAALADAAARSGEWLACRPGCTPCCIGVFRINPLDALRLREGLLKLESTDPEKATEIRERSRRSVERLRGDFPGDREHGILHEGKQADLAFKAFANDEPCSALNPSSGLCELYESRPMTCRVFGPPVQSEGGLGTCELCFNGATDEEVAACEMRPDPDDLELTLLKNLEKTSGSRGDTIVAFCLAE